MTKDPKFQNFVDKVVVVKSLLFKRIIPLESNLIVFLKQVVGEVKIEGGHRKPEWGDLFVVRLLLLPSVLYKWTKRYHRIHFLKQVTSYFLSNRQ